MPRDEKRRANGLGTVIKRGDKYRWMLTLGYTRVPDGNGGTRLKRQSVNGTARTQTDAERALARAIADHGRGLIAPASDITLEAYAATWLKRQTNLQPSSLEAYRWELGFPLRTLGSKRVKDIKPATLKDYVSSLPQATVTHGGGAPEKRSTRPMSPRTQGKIVTRLRSLFAEAVSDQIIYTNPMDAVKRPRGHAPEVVGRVYDFHEAQRCRAVGDTLHRLEMLRAWIAVLLGLSLGMRRGEILALTWADVDLRGATLRVTRGLTGMTGGAPVFGPPKTKASKREIAIPRSLLVALEAHRDRQALERGVAGRAWLDTGAIVATEIGGYTNPTNLIRTLETVRFWSDARNLEPADTPSPLLGVPLAKRATLETLARAGPALPHIRVHDLRHTYATLALRSKVPVEVVAKTLGHTRISITMDTYRHVLESEMRGNAFDLLAL